MPDHNFDDGEAYEQFMGRWSRELSLSFIRWLEPPAGMRWLDVGCGTGIFTQVILDTCSPEAAVGIDCANAQIAHARQSVAGHRAAFQVADAQLLPFANDSFDVVASALAINFVPDRPRALAEMCRVTRSGGFVGGCVWDFAAERSPSWPVRVAMARLGIEAPPIMGAADSTRHVLTSMFQQAGFEDVVATSIDVAASFASFEEFWRTQTPSYAPITKVIAQMPERTRTKLQDVVRAELPTLEDGRIALSARANAVRGRGPAKTRR